MTRGWTWAAYDQETYNQLASNDTAGALNFRKTLDSYYGNSYLIPTVLSYAMLGTAILLLLATSLFAGTPSLRRRFPRILTQFSKQPTFSRKHAELAELLPTLPPKNGSYVRRSLLSFQIPLRSQTLAITAILIVNLVGILGFYTPTEGPLNYYWPENSTYIQIVRYVSDRSGILAQAQLILVFLLSGRNSPVQLLTFGAISFETQMVLHRWVARMTVIQALVHSIGYSLYSLHYGKETYYESFEPYLNWGVACTVLFFFMLFAAIRNIRQRGYEVFYFLHVFFSVLIIITVYYHIALLKSESLQDYINWIWAAVAIWVFDRVVRILRQVLLNFGFDSSSKTIKFSKASLISTTSFSDPDHPLILRVRPAGAAKSLVPKWSPGNHVFLNHSGVQPYASHPFTVISVGNDSSPYLDLVIRPQSGFTRKLVDVSRGKSDVSTVFIDGPYGHALELYHTSILLLVGGVGITYCLPFFVKEIEKSIVSNSISASKQESQARKEVHLIWAIKKVEMLCIVVPYLEHAVSALRQDQTSDSSLSNFALTVHLTETPIQKLVEQDEQVLDGESSNLSKQAASDRSSTKSLSNEKNEKEEKLGSEELNEGSDGKSLRQRLESLSPEIKVTFKSERPDLGKVIETSHQSLGVGSNGAEMAVVACGPSSLCDDSRAKATLLKEVDYYEEGFTW